MTWGQTSRGLLALFRKPTDNLPEVYRPANSQFSISNSGGELRQAEIVSDLNYYEFEASQEDIRKLGVKEVRVPYSIILTPDCDLLQHHKKRSAGEEPSLINILCFAMSDASGGRQVFGKSKDEWKHIKQNEMSQYHFISAIDAQFDLLGKGLPELLIDFKRYFCLAPSEILRQCGLPDQPKADRRCFLGAEWRQELQQRAMAYMQRVGVPDPSDHVEKRPS